MQERDRISAEMHDDLSGSITAISYLSKLGLEKTDSKTRDYFSRIEDLSRQVTQGMTDIIWLMNSHNQSVNEFASYIHTYAEDFLSTQNIDLDFTEEIAGSHIILRNNLRKDLLLSVKECLHNIQKHAHATKVNIDILQINGKIRIVIKDNGVGIQHKNNGLSGNGLVNMRNRMNRHQGSIEWKNDQGTSVIFEVPF